MLLVDGLEQGSQPFLACQVRRQRHDLAQSGQFLTRLFGLFRAVAHDHGAAAFGENHPGRLQSHSAGAADDQQLLAFELIAHCETSLPAAWQIPVEEYADK